MEKNSKTIVNLINENEHLKNILASGKDPVPKAISYLINNCGVDYTTLCDFCFQYFNEGDAPVIYRDADDKYVCAECAKKFAPDIVKTAFNESYDNR